MRGEAGWGGGCEGLLGVSVISAAVMLTFVLRRICCVVPKDAVSEPREELRLQHPRYCSPSFNNTRQPTPPSPILSFVEKQPAGTILEGA